MSAAHGSPMLPLALALLGLSCSAELVVVAESEKHVGTGGSNTSGAAGDGGFGGAGAVGGTVEPGTGGASGPGGAGAGGSAASGGFAGAAGGSGSGGATAGIFCTGDSGCAGSSFCELDSCTSSSGRCREQIGCEDTLAPSCGCSGLTYWNDCLRVSAGETQAASSACSGPTAVACGGAAETPCSDNRLCVVSAGGCGSALDGTCWDVPCPQPDSGLRFSSCDGSLVCLDGCSARAGLVRVSEDSSCM